MEIHSSSSIERPEVFCIICSLYSYLEVFQSDSGVSLPAGREDKLAGSHSSWNSQRY